MASFTEILFLDELGVIVCYGVWTRKRTYADVRSIAPIPGQTFDERGIAHQDHGRDCAKCC